MYIQDMIPLSSQIASVTTALWKNLSELHTYIHTYIHMVFDKREGEGERRVWE